MGLQILDSLASVGGMWYHVDAFLAESNPDCPHGLPSVAFARRRVGGGARVALVAVGLSREKKMCMLDVIRAKRDEIYAIARKHKAEKLWVFGSCARKEERPDSDIDLLVKFRPQTTIFDYVRMQDDVSKLLGCGVDVVDCEALEHERYFAREVQRDMVAI